MIPSYRGVATIFFYHAVRHLLSVDVCVDRRATDLDASSRHPDLAWHSLDWADTLDNSKQPAVQALLDQADVDMIVGADLVRRDSMYQTLYE